MIVCCAELGHAYRAVGLELLLEGIAVLQSKEHVNT